MYVDTELRATTVRTLGTKYAATVSGCTVMKRVSTASMRVSSSDELHNNVQWQCAENNGTLGSKTTMQDLVNKSKRLLAADLVTYRKPVTICAWQQGLSS